MAKFIYKLQNILDIKMRLETQAKTEYAEAASRLYEEQDKLRELYNRKKKYEESYRENAEGKLDFAALMRLHQAIETIKQYIQRQLVAVHIAERNLEIARQKLNEAMQDRKTHEKLKENAFEEFLQELNDQEKKEIDELVSYKYNESEEQPV